VSLSRADLIHRQPDRKEQNMAKWTFAGAAGAVVGPLALGAAIEMGSGWRTLYALTATLSSAALAIAARSAFPAGRAKAREGEPNKVLRESWTGC